MAKADEGKRLPPPPLPYDPLLDLLGPRGPQGPAYPVYPSEQQTRTPAEQDAYVAQRYNQPRPPLGLGLPPMGPQGPADLPVPYQPGGLAGPSTVTSPNLQQTLGRSAPANFDQFAAPADQRGADTTGFGAKALDYVNRYASPQGVAQEALGVGQSVLRQLGDTKNAAAGLFGPMAGPPQAGFPKGKATPLQAESVTNVLGGIAGVAASPFSAVAAGIAERQVALDPVLGPKFKSEIATLPKDQQTDSGIRSEVAHRLIDSQAALLIQAIDDPHRTDDEKRAAFAAASLLTLERVAEFGGPQMLQQIGHFVAPRVLAELDAAIARTEAAATRTAGEGTGLRNLATSETGLAGKGPGPHGESTRAQELLSAKTSPADTKSSAPANATVSKGTYYFRSGPAAEAWAVENGWPTDRIVRFDKGHAVQSGKSGNYAGPGEQPKGWYGADSEGKPLPAPTTAAEATSSAPVKLLITKADEAALKKRGYTEPEIDRMKPEEAGLILSGDVNAKAANYERPATGRADTTSPELEAAQALGEGGSLKDRIGGQSLGVPEEGAGPAQTPEQMAGVRPPRYIVDNGKTVTTIMDTTTGKRLPTAFTGDNRSAVGAAEAAKRNAALDARNTATQAVAAAMPLDHDLRTLTSAQLGELRRTTKDPVQQKLIDLLLGERAFAIAPDDQLASALQAIPREIHSQVRKALRSAIGGDLTPEQLVAVPGMRKVLDDAVASRHIEPNLGNRNQLAQQLLDQGRADNLRNLARNAKNKTGNPVADQVIADLSHVDGDLKAGVPAVHVFEDTVDAVMAPVENIIRASVEPGVGPDMAAVRAATAARRGLTVEALTPEQQAASDAVHSAPIYQEGQQTLLPREGVPGGSPGAGDGGGKLPPIEVAHGVPPSPGDRARGILGAALHKFPDLVQATRFVAGFDLSAAFRQTFPVFFNHPQSYVKGNAQGFMDLFKTADGFANETQKMREAIEATGVSANIEDGGLISSIGGGIVKGEERFAGLDWIREKIPSLDKVKVLGGLANANVRFEQAYVGAINAVRTQAYLGSVKQYESALGRALTIEEKQGLVHDIRVITGRGFRFPQAGTEISVGPLGTRHTQTTSDTVVAVAKLANGLGFSPTLAVARFRLITDTPKAVANIAWAIGHKQPPSVKDIEFVRGTAGYLASVASMWGIAKASGLNIDLNLDSSRFGLIELGKPSADMGKATAVAEFLGLSTQTHSGLVFLDPGQGVGQDIKLLYRMIGPMFGQLPRDQKGNAWNPWQPKTGESSVTDLLVNFAENKLLPGAGVVAQTASGHAPDMADLTQNPVTSLLIPLWMQAGLSASGLTSQGGLVYNAIQGATGWGKSPADVEKQRLGIDVPTVPGMNQLGADRQKQFDDKATAAVQSRLASVVKSPAYLAANDTDKKKLIDTNTTAVGRDAKRTLAIQIATTGKPEELVSALGIALGQSSGNLQKGQALATVEAAGRLTPDVAKQLDAQRKQTDHAKPNYEPTVSELTQAKSLADRWLAAPEFSSGTKSDWDKAAAAAVHLRLLRAEDLRKGVDPGTDTQLVKFYMEQGSLSQFYTFAGSKNPRAVGADRLAIQKLPLWGLVATSAGKIDHPTAP